MDGVILYIRGNWNANYKIGLQWLSCKLLVM
jgi:hypothetical protein